MLINFYYSYILKLFFVFIFNAISTKLILVPYGLDPGHILEAGRKEVASQLRKITVHSDAGSEGRKTDGSTRAALTERPIIYTTFTRD